MASGIIDIIKGHKKLFKIKDISDHSAANWENLGFDIYAEKKKYSMNLFAHKVDPIMALFKFYGLILAVTLITALIVFLVMVVFGKMPVLSFSLLLLPAMIFTPLEHYCNIAYRKGGIKSRFF